MKTRLILALAMMLPFFAQANDSQIYIQQSGQGLTLNINQAGENNVIGDLANTTPFILNGIQQDLRINQFGSNNTLFGEIFGDSIQGFWEFVGDNNEMNFSVNPGGLNSADAGQYIFNVSGSNNEFTITVADNAVADNAFMDWDIVGDFNLFTTRINSDNYSSILAVFGNYNEFDITASGASGHSVDIDHTGDYTNFVISQTATLESNTIKLQTTTSGTANAPSTICIHQSDSGTTGC
jgi:hypothetical protein